MREVTSKRLGNALRRLAEDLATERGRVATLQRENKELRTRLAALRVRLEEHAPPSQPPDGAPRR
ncbi:MAG TPA: hypothetical protein VMA77_08270 [Solirubrobacteraceae bacterium]|nr:hypothetical protein [Solirubrobacteraceae bacterium]